MRGDNMTTEEPRPVEETPPAPAAPTEAPDLAPDADEPGDALPDDLQEHVHEGPVEPDEVDQKEVQE